MCLSYHIPGLFTTENIYFLPLNGTLLKYGRVKIPMKKRIGNPSENFGYASLFFQTAIGCSAIRARIDGSSNSNSGA